MSKVLHKKFAPILIVSQKWHHSEKTTSITFDLDMILTGGFFQKSYFLKVFQFRENIKYFFWSPVPP